MKRKMLKLLAVVFTAVSVVFVVTALCIIYCLIRMPAENGLDKSLIIIILMLGASYFAFCFVVISLIIRQGYKIINKRNSNVKAKNSKL